MPIANFEITGDGPGGTRYCLLQCHSVLLQIAAKSSTQGSSEDRLTTKQRQVFGLLGSAPETANFALANPAGVLKQLMEAVTEPGARRPDPGTQNWKSIVAGG